MSKQDQETPKKAGKGRLVLILLLVVLLLGGGAAGAYLTGLVQIAPLGAAAAMQQGAGDKAAARKVIFVDLPDLLVNMNLSGPRLRFLRLVAALEVGSEPAAEEVRRLVPRISDNVHLYLRSLGPDEMEGAQGIYRIKRDLLARINQIVEPVEVHDVLIKELLVQ